ncbi:MAG: DUF3014 domain-containing protein [Methyloglobulus sp.]|nr:DUF3014 domain-containing protein [Methyloglobulus sp.]
MSRYDRNRNKKSNNTIFILAVLVSLAVVISGTYYVLENYKQLKQAETIISDKVSVHEIATSEQFPEERLLVEESELELLNPTGSETVVSHDDQASSVLSGLPDLLSSDDMVRQALIKIAPGLASWLSTDQLIRKHMLIVNDFAQGIRISKHMSFLRMAGPFSVEQSRNELNISPKSYQRYDNIAQVFQSIDAKSAVGLYQKFRPLMLLVFAEFSYPKDITLESIIKKAGSEILAAPALEGQIALVRPSVFYKFADAKLETLNPVQKQMIRMGAVNTRIIQAKCREFLVELAKSDLK